MQFTYPAFLGAFFLLLIPILVHLLQLRKFEKTPFTNVKLLQKIVTESTRSNTLKRWLLLITRLGMLTALILAFAKPYTGATKGSESGNSIFYIDNSFSMQARDQEGALLENAVQDFIKNCPKDQIFTLFTNNETYTNVRIQDIQEDLLSLGYTGNQLTFPDIFLKVASFGKQETEEPTKLVLISDFQERMGIPRQDSLANNKVYLVTLQPQKVDNVSIDSVYITKEGIETLELKALLSAEQELEGKSISLFNGDKLIAKTSASFKNNRGEALFTVPANQELKGKVQIEDASLSFDNSLYVSVDKKNKIKVLAIGEDTNYLYRLFNDPDFTFTASPLNQLDYAHIESQNFVILNSLNRIPDALIQVISEFYKNGGSVVVVPSADVDLASYNKLLQLGRTQITARVDGPVQVTKINFNHPLYDNVFEKEVQNFQYPTVKTYYTVKSPMDAFLSYSNGEAFGLGASGFYVMTAGLGNTNSNFKNAPLIVPTFYNMALQSLRFPDLYFMTDQNDYVDLPVVLQKDQVVKMKKDETDYIPRQLAMASKTRLSFLPNTVKEAGIYTAMQDSTKLTNIAFDLPRNENQLQYLDLTKIKLGSATQLSGVTTFFEQMKSENKVQEHWKGFIILALLLMLLEMAIQKWMPATTGKALRDSKIATS